MSVVITSVTERSPAAKAGVKAGETLAAINGHPINDALDYGFYCYERTLTLDLVTRTVKVRKKDDYDDIGLNFETYLMDKKHSCRNKCVFCFIDQLPPGMRETLYFKDDDSRLSFLQGSYITLTNMTDSDIERIIKMKLNVNVSVHTTDPELRKKMLCNRFAGDVLRYIKQMEEGGITMNCQIVLCRGYNDGEHLRKTLSDLTELYPAVQSVAVVPFGATKFREGLPQIQLHDKQSAGEAIDIIESFGDAMLEKYGERVVYPADELFITAGRELPPSEYYGSFDQYENGVGMWAYLRDGFADELAECEGDGRELHISSATGVLAAPLMVQLAGLVKDKFPNVSITVYPISNDFFGHTVTVAGLVTGGDLINRLTPHKHELGEYVIIPRSMLKADEDIFLDDVTLAQVSEALGVPVIPAGGEPEELLSAMLGEI
ncbi:MAG: DUF512 domain-containing protein [Ruminiclostridium sp.]|nr:DUF512 domain-containing protein [Ruminiclostridium sp.]